jgi:hypothetical protein
MSWMDERAEQAMREGTQKIMEEAQKRAQAEFKEIGKWTITMTGNKNVTKEDIDSFMNKLVEFAKQADIDAPNIQVSIDPAN